VNAYAILILVALIAEYVLNVVADLLNLKALEPELPREFSDVYDAERYRKSQEYTRVRTRFGLISATFHLVVLLTFWFAGGFPWLDGMVRSFELPPIVTGLLFIGCLGIASALLSVPFRWYSTFVIEEHFGFNKTAPKTFLSDAIKGLLLAVVLGGPLLAVVLWFFQGAGPLAWLWCWLAAAAFLVFVQFIAPTWIFPIFNKFEPLDEGELRESIMRYAQKVAFPVKGLFVIDGSRRTTKANALFTGFGRRKRVALFDTLIEKHPPDEIVAIVAHEIGHYKKAHILKGLAISIVQLGIVFVLLSIFLKSEGLFAAFYVQDQSIYAGLVFFGMLFSPIDLVLSFFVQAFSRRNEFEADAYARNTALAAELVSGLKRLSGESLSNLTPHPLYVKLHYSHPPLAERIAALRGGPGPS
jgi:STE24 endopeptidase